MVDIELMDDLEMGPSVVARLSWGAGELDVPRRDVAEPALGNRADSRGGRPLRPLPRLRPDRSARLTVLVDDDPAVALRFVVIDRVGTRSLLLDSAPPPPGGRAVVDFVPDGSGGVFLLEFVLNSEPTNQLRYIDSSGRTLWSRTGPVDHRNSDPAGLRGVFLSLHLTDEGGLWLVPRLTSSGLAEFDSATGDLVGTRSMDLDVANPIVSAQGRAYYGRMADADSGHRYPLLAVLDLSSGQTSYVDYGPVPLLHLAGVDRQGRVLARTRDGVRCLYPDGTTRTLLRVAGVVVAPANGPVIIADPMNPETRTVAVSEFGAEGRRRWLVPIDTTAATGEHVLVAVDEGPVFVFQADGSEREPGQLLFLDAQGSQTRPSLTGDQAAAELDRRESRTDPAQFVVDDRGAVYLPVSDPHGYSVLCWAPPETGSGTEPIVEGLGGIH